MPKPVACPRRSRTRGTARRPEPAQTSARARHGDVHVHVSARAGPNSGCIIAHAQARECARRARVPERLRRARFTVIGGCLRRAACARPSRLVPAPPAPRPPCAAARTGASCTRCPFPRALGRRRCQSLERSAPPSRGEQKARDTRGADAQVPPQRRRQAHPQGRGLHAAAWAPPLCPDGARRRPRQARPHNSALKLAPAPPNIAVRTGPTVSRSPDRRYQTVFRSSAQRASGRHAPGWGVGRASGGRAARAWPCYCRTQACVCDASRACSHAPMAPARPRAQSRRWRWRWKLFRARLLVPAAWHWEACTGRPACSL